MRNQAFEQRRSHCVVCWVLCVGTNLMFPQDNGRLAKQQWATCVFGLGESLLGPNRRRRGFVGRERNRYARDRL